MGHRTIKRVPLNFEWPMNKIWSGYVLPDTLSLPPCPDCKDGYNPATSALSRDFYASYLPYESEERKNTEWLDKITQDEVQALVDNGRLVDFTHTFVSGKGWVLNDPATIPTSKEVNEWARNSRSIVHDALNQMILIETRAKRLGIWGVCETCKGTQTTASEEALAQVDAWEPSEPPEGKGWQLWETVSDGSPISPVFVTAKALAAWCEDNASLRPDLKLDRDEWRQLFLNKRELEYQSFIFM